MIYVPGPSRNSQCSNIGQAVGPGLTAWETGVGNWQNASSIVHYAPFLRLGLSAFVADPSSAIFFSSLSSKTVANELMD